MTDKGIEDGEHLFALDDFVKGFCLKKKKKKKIEFLCQFASLVLVRKVS